jgi:hypothetical protein
VDVAVELAPPGGFEAEATLQLSGVHDEHFALLLNRDLSVTEATAVGCEVSVAHGFRWGGRYHSEGRVLHFDLSELPEDGRVTLNLRWSGEAEFGPAGSDWRGILLVDEHETRMCEQTIFCPQVPTTTAGPAVQGSTFTLAVTAPAAWEMYPPGRSLGPPVLSGDRRTWSYASDVPALFSIVGGDRVRGETIVGNRRVVTLLLREHADMGPEFATESDAILDAYNGCFGGGGDGSMCLFEQSNRKGYSYNWFANGLSVFDRSALNASLPRTQLAHEMAHLWWGQAVVADGPGERFLTEGMSEASCWLFFERSGRGGEAAWGLGRARKDVRELAEDGGSLELKSVAFGVSHYNELAYDKGGLVQRHVMGTLGVERGIEFVAASRGRAVSGVVTLADWKAALVEVAPDLAVPWVEHPGDFELWLDDVAFDRARAVVTGSIAAKVVGSEQSIPLQALVEVEVLGPGFVSRELVIVDGATTAFEFSVSPEDMATSGGAVFAVTLDPHEWLPLGGEKSAVLWGPRLVASSPEQGADDVLFGLTQIEVSFDEPLRSFDAEQYKAERSGLSAHVLAPRVRSVAFADEGRTVIFEESPLLPGKDYELPLRGALQSAEGAVLVPRCLSFTTAPSTDTKAPEVISCNPPNGVTNLPLSTTEIVTVFDEPMMAGTGFDSSDMRDLGSDGYAHPEMDFGHWDESGTVWTIPLKELHPGVEYALPIGRPVKDLSGNTAAKFVYYFTTEGPIP